MKKYLIMLLCVFASNDDQMYYAKAQAIEYLLKKKLVVANGDDITMTDKAVKLLKKYFGISFKGE